jgi:hypothetical protein
VRRSRTAFRLPKCGAFVLHARLCAVVLCRVAILVALRCDVAIGFRCVSALQRNAMQRVSLRRCREVCCDEVRCSEVVRAVRCRTRDAAQSGAVRCFSWRCVYC